MTEENAKKPEPLHALPTCMVRGRRGRFFLLKLLPVKARLPARRLVNKKSPGILTQRTANALICLADHLDRFGPVPHC
jgi:hypothetical protein